MHANTIHSTPWQIVSLILGSAYIPQTAGGHLKIRVLPWPADIVGVPTGPGGHVHVSYSRQILIYRSIVRKWLCVSVDVPCGTYTLWVPFFYNHPYTAIPRLPVPSIGRSRLLIYRRTRDRWRSITWATKTTEI